MHWHQPTAYLVSGVFSFLILHCSEEEKSDGLWNAPRVLNIKGLGRSVAECCEAERVLTKALFEMLGERSRHKKIASSSSTMTMTFLELRQVEDWTVRSLLSYAF